MRTHKHTKPASATVDLETATPTVPNGNGVRIPWHDFYMEYHGHTDEHLHTAHAALTQNANGESRSTIFLLGDSSFDNKYWFSESSPAVNGYERLLEPPRSGRDIAYWVNKHLVEEGLGERTYCLNCAVEESTVGGERENGGLLQQDEFVRDHLTSNDVLMLSLGGNDIALAPTFSTIVAVAALVMQPISWGKYKLGFDYMRRLFKNKIEDYIQTVCSKNKPKAVVVCMIYFLDENSGAGWAEGALSKLGYNSNPAKLQSLIELLFIEATSKIEVEGVKIVPMALHKVLDGKVSTDYVERVEPSAQGGQKIGKALVETFKDILASEPEL